MKITILKIISILFVTLALVQCTAPLSMVPISTNIIDEQSTREKTTTVSSLEIITESSSDSFTLDELRAALPTATMTIDDPLYKRTKTYEGFWLTDLLTYSNLLEEDGDEIRFRAADGYETRLDRIRLNAAQPKGLVAFRDVDAEGQWEPFIKGKSEMVPAPFYLIWAVTDNDVDVEKPTPRQWPWPYQLTTIELIDFESTYDRLYPIGVEPTTDIYQGFRLFTETCIKCHSINLQGGTQGPELNIPQNITEYWDHDTLIAFIKNPTSFRLGSQMPAFETKLTSQELEQVLTYVGWMADHKWQDVQ